MRLDFNRDEGEWVRWDKAVLGGTGQHVVEYDGMGWEGVRWNGTG